MIRKPGIFPSGQATPPHISTHQSRGEMKNEKTRVAHEGSALSEELSKRLAAYVLAATAAAAALLAAATPAEANIITYKPTTPFTVTPTTPTGIFSSRGQALLGFTDSHRTVPPGPRPGTFGTAFLGVQPGGPQGAFIANSVAGARFFSAGSFIGSGPLFASQQVLICSHTRSGAGRDPFCQNANGYLGLKFVKAGKDYFGWAKMAAGETSNGAFNATLYEVAVDTVAGQSIKADQTSAVPEPATLALLALGAAGLIALRKRKSATGRQTRAND
jgi:hypothetical protein